MTIESTAPAAPAVDPTDPAQVHLWFDPSRFSRGQLLKAAKLRQMDFNVSLTNVELIGRFVEWLDANGIVPPPPAVEAEDDDDDAPFEDLSDTFSISVAEQTPAAGAAPSAVVPAAGKPTSAATPAPPADVVTVPRDEWERMQAAIARLTAAQDGGAGKPLAEVAAPAPVAVGANGMPQKTGLFPGGYRAEHYVGPRGLIDDALHFQFIEATHAAARDAGYRSKGAPLAGLRVGFSTDERGGRTAIYEVAVFKED